MMTNSKGKQGLASMSPEKRKAIASRGGKASQASGRGYRWDSAKAAAAGRIGGSRRKITGVWCWCCATWYTRGPHVCTPCTLEDTACISRQEAI